VTASPASMGSTAKMSPRRAASTTTAVATACASTARASATRALWESIATPWSRVPWQIARDMVHAKAAGAFATRALAETGATVILDALGPFRFLALPRRAAVSILLALGTVSAKTGSATATRVMRALAARSIEPVHASAIRTATVGGCARTAHAFATKVSPAFRAKLLCRATAGS